MVLGRLIRDDDGLSDIGCLKRMANLEKSSVEYVVHFITIVFLQANKIKLSLFSHQIIVVSVCDLYL